MESKQDLVSLLRESSSATEDSELAKIGLLYEIKSIDILDFVGNSDSIVMIKNVLTNENLPLRYALVPAVGNLLIRSWVILHEEDLEAYVSGMDTRQDVLRRKEDFLECIGDFFKQLAHYATGSPPNADIKLESMDHTMAGFNAYSSPIIELLSSFADCEKLIDEWTDSLCGLTNHIATSIRTNLSSQCFYRSVDLSPLVQKVLDVLMADPFLLMQSALTKAADSQSAMTLMNKICHCILKRLPPESPIFVTLQPIESKVDLFSRLPDNKASNSLLSDHTDDSRKQTEPLSSLQFISDWIYCGMLPNLSEYNNILVDILTVISHHSLYTIRRKISEAVIMKLVSLSDRDITCCAQQLFLFPSSSLSTLCPPDRSPSFWLLTRLGQCILNHFTQVDEKMVIIRLLSEWVSVILDAHFDDLLDCQFPSYHSWIALPGRDALIIDVNDGHSSSNSDVHGSRWQATAFKLTLQELLKPHSHNNTQHPNLTQTNSVIGELVAVITMRSLYGLIENIVWILNQGIQKVDFTALQTTNKHDTFNNDYLDETDDVNNNNQDQFAAWEERIEQLLIASLHRIASRVSHVATDDLSDGMERSSVYILQGSRRKMLYPAVLLTANSILIKDTVTRILREQRDISSETILTSAIIDELLQDERKRVSLVQKLQVRAITRLASTLVMIMDEALFALRLFMPVQIKWIQRQNGVIAGVHLISLLSSILNSHNKSHNPLTTYLFQHSADSVECEQQAVFLSSLLIWQVEIVTKLSASDLVRLRSIPALLQLSLARNHDSKKIHLISFILSYCKALLTRGVEEREISENRTARVSAGMLGGGNDEQPTYSDGSNGFGSGLYLAQEIAVEILKLLLAHLSTISQEEDGQVKIFLASMLEIETELFKAEVMLLIPSLLPGHPRVIKGQEEAFVWTGSTVIREQLCSLIRQTRVIAIEKKIQVNVKSQAAVDELIIAVLGTKKVSRFIMSTLRSHLMSIMHTLSPLLKNNAKEGNGHHLVSPSSSSAVTLDLLDSLDQSPPSVITIDSSASSSSIKKTDVLLLGFGALYDPAPRTLASSSAASVQGLSHYADTIAVVDDVVNSCFTPLYSSFLTFTASNDAKEELTQLAALLALDTEELQWQDLTGSSDLLTLQGAFLFIDQFTKQTTIKLRAYNNTTFRLPPFTLRLSISQEKDAMFPEERHFEFNEFLPVNSFIEREISVQVRKFAALEVKVFVEWSDMRRNDSQSIISFDSNHSSSSSTAAVTATANGNENGSNESANKERVWTAITQSQSLHLPISQLLLPCGNGSLCSMQYYSDCSSRLLYRHERASTRHQDGIPWRVFAAQFQRLGSKFEQQIAVNLTSILNSKELYEAISEAVQYSQSNVMWLGLDCISQYPSASTSTAEGAIMIGWSLQTLWGNELSILLDGQGGDSKGVLTVRCSDKPTLQVLSNHEETVASLVQAITGGTVSVIRLV